MPSWVTALLPYVAPVVIGLITTMIGTAALSGRRLRSELTSDAQIIGALTRQSQALLRAEMTRKTTLMVAMSQHPVLVFSDLLRLAAMALACGLMGLTAYDVADTGVISDAVVGAVVFLGINDRAFVSFARSLESRREARQKMTGPLSPMGSDANLSAYWAQSIVLVLAFAITMPPVLLVVVVARETALPDSAPAIAILAAAGYMSWTLLHRLRKRPR